MARVLLYFDDPATRVKIETASNNLHVHIKTSNKKFIIQLSFLPNFLMPLSNPCYFIDAKFGDLNYYHTEHFWIKVQLIKFTLSSVNKH